MTSIAHSSTFALALLALAACRQPGTQQAGPAPWTVGSFDFTIRSGSTVMLGMFETRYDTVIVRPRDGSCFFDRTAQTLDERAVFKCDGVSAINDLTLSIDRRDPASRSRWSGTFTRMVAENQCTAFGTDSRGNRICIASRTVNVERTESLSGSIVVRSKAPTAP